jgi:hypothetical protein
MKNLFPWEVLKSLLPLYFPEMRDALNFYSNAHTKGQT